ncbi:hypothetical protein [Nocardia suismassiliense]|uniref:hypothetical protein n=1 Tax=Nocardia suismassiliense TaxID=2077092 RepID=UPI00131EFEE6|nr:hypothetical protein [Nocardia suismassiliense]
MVAAADASGVLAFDWLEHAATRCAQDGVPIEVVHAAVTESVMSALDRHGSASNAIDDGWNVRCEPAAPASLLDDLIAVVSRAYG